MAQTSGPNITARISLEDGDVDIRQLKDIGEAGAQAGRLISSALAALGRLARTVARRRRSAWRRRLAEGVAALVAATA
jgi:hypothetical protein